MTTAATSSAPVPTVSVSDQPSAPVAPKLRPRPRLGLGSALIGKEEEQLVLQVLHSRDLFRYYGHDPANPPQMAAQLEKELREMVGAKYALAVTSGTAALEVALAALGVGPGDEVIVPAWSWISCFTSVVRVGALPVLAEIDDTFCIAPGEITRLKSANTKAVIVVHYQGVAADLDALCREAADAGIKLLEDCAESLGASYHGKPLGSIGDISIFSFQHNKFATSGEGGAVATSDPLLYERAVRMSDLGQVRPYHQEIARPQTEAFAGDQFRMSELTAAVALGQLRRVERIKIHCRRIRQRIVDGIAGLPGLAMRRIPDADGDTAFEVYFSLPTADQANEFRTRLDAMNVNSRQTTGTYCHYARDYCITGLAHHPKASPFAKFKTWPAPGYRKEDFPRTESIIHGFIALPIGALYTDQDADYIAQCVRHVHAEMAIQ